MTSSPTSGADRVRARSGKASYAAVALWGAFLGYVFARSLWIDAGGLWVAHENQWSDWPLHLGMIRRFATLDPAHWFAHHPMYAYGKATYPFATNLVTGLLARIGLAIPTAVIASSVALVAILLIALERLLVPLSGSARRAAFAMSAFFLSSGPGFAAYVAEHWRGGTIEPWWLPTKHYSRIDASGWYAGNVIVGLIVPQRAFLAGMALGATALALFLRAYRHHDAGHRAAAWRAALFAGVCAGLLPIVHAHSAIVVAITALAIGASRLDARRVALAFGATALPLAITLYATFIAGGIVRPGFMRFLPGWSAGPDVLAWMSLWWRLWGPMLPLTLAGLILLIRDNGPREIKGLALGLTTAFVLANLMLFQPVAWDNSKIFFWSYAGFAALAARALAAVWAWRAAGPAIACVLGASLVLTGILELAAREVRLVLRPSQILSARELEITDRVSRETAPGSVFATNASHGHPIMAWGARPILVGFTPWVENFGFDAGTRHEALLRIFAGGEAALKEIRALDVSYVYFGGYERNMKGANEAFFRAHFPVAFHNDDVTIYDTRSKTPRVEPAQGRDPAAGDGPAGAEGQERHEEGERDG